MSLPQGGSICNLSVVDTNGILNGSMDHITDEKIRHVVDSQMKGFTVIAVAHRICTF
jgi:hypothetical protein